MDERVSKLPAWAREHIERQDRRIAELEADLAREVANEPTRTWMANGYDFNEPRRYFGDYSGRARFEFHHKHLWLDVQRAPAIEGDGIEVVGSERFAIHPGASNRVFIFPRGR